MADAKGAIAVAMGVIIGLLDIYWTYTSYFNATWLAIGIVIFVADLVWLWVDIGAMKRRR